MNEGTSNKPSILKQVARGVLIATVIAVSALVVLSSLVPRANPPAVQTLTCIQALAGAVQGFEDVYEKLPNVSMLDFETEGLEAVKLITVLLGKEEEGQGNIQNPRQIAFLTGRMTKHRKQGGIIFRSDYEADGIYDSWGNPLRIILRSPGQSTLVVPHLGKQVTTSKPAVVLSRGPDQKWGTEDDIISRTDGP